MSPQMNSGEFQQSAAKIEELLERATALTDADARATALELVQSFMDLQGAAVTRVVGILSESGEAGRTALAKLGRDPMVCGLMVLYGVHPVALEDRVKGAIEQVTPQLRKNGASLELIEVSETAVHIKLETTAHGCGSSPDAAKQLVEQAIREAAPEIAEVIAEGAPSNSTRFISVNMIKPATKEETNYEKSAV
ncbi:MAG: NifU family protein [Terriglobales bacterium]